MSFWTSVRKPLIGTATLGGIGTMGGLGYDYVKNEGMFEKPGIAPQEYGAYNGQRPDIPGFTSAADNPNDPNSLANGVQQRLNQPIGPGYEKFSKMALEDGPSAWALQQRENLQSDLNQGAQDLSQSLAGRNATEFSRASAGRGLTASQRARMVKQSIDAEAQGRQNLSASANRQLGDVAAADYQRREGMLNTLQGTENANKNFGISSWAAARGSDLARAQAEADRKNQFELNKYGIQSDLYGQDANVWASDRLAREKERLAREG